MKKMLYILVLLGSTLSCDNPMNRILDEQNSTPIQNNDLLPNKVIVYNEVNFKTQSIPEWTSGVDSIYMNGLNDLVLASNVKCYSASVYYDPTNEIEMPKNEVAGHMQVSNPLGINALYFIESWEFNQNSFTFKKNVESWSPVFEFIKDNDGEKYIAKKLLYDVKGVSQNEEQLIAQNMTYEVSFNSEAKTSEFLDVKKMARLISEPVSEGKMKAYDFMLDTEMPLNEVKEQLGYAIDSLEEEDPVTGTWVWKYIERPLDFNSIEGFIFVEDWYIDTQSLSIRKQVKSIAPVVYGYRIDENGDAIQYKRIAFNVKLSL